MDTKVRIGMLGAWQDHAYRFAHYIATEGYYSDSMKHWSKQDYSGCEIVAVWDDVPGRGKKLAETFQCCYEPDLSKFFHEYAIDAVIVCSETARHAEHIIAAANAKKHIFVEKAPFTTLEGAYLAREAIRRNGVTFVVSSPMDKPRVRYVKQMIDEGKLGEISLVRFRLYDRFALDVTQPHSIFNREEGGGGAMIDYGQHGVHILNWFLGMPESVSAHFNYVSDFAKKYQTEDNAVAVYKFKNGALGIVEAGWCAPAHECVLEVYGTNGRVRVMGDDYRFHEDGSVSRFDEITYTLKDENTVLVPREEYPSPIKFPLHDWISSIMSGEPTTRMTIDESVAWTEMLAAAYRAAVNGETIL